MAFDVATYTDVVASEAVDGVDGFNFQSVSPGVTGVDQQRIRESLLHRIVPSWALEHDPLHHPGTCAYVVQEGRFYLSRGRSTGDTNSGRPGNQITQAIITSDPDDFVPYRPAQLYGATEWTLEKAPSTTSDSWVTPLEIKPEFEVAALESMVTEDDWASTVLPHFLTMIEEAVTVEPKKLVLIHSDLDVVMRWIALGSLFVDADAARLLQFRALVDDPWRADAILVGVSPDFGRTELSAANTLDLSSGSLPSIEPSDSARVRAAWFLEQGADDALNAIEIARRWESSLGTDLANDAARIVGLPEAVVPGQSAWLASMAATERLASAGLREDLALYAEELCDAVFGYGPTSGQEFGLAGRAIRKAHDLEVDDLASGMLVPTLEALTAVPASIDSFARELSGSYAPVRWDSTESREAASAFIGELMASAPVDALSELFSAARVIAAPIAEQSLTGSVQRLADAWVKEPTLGSTVWRNWLAGHAVLAAVVQSLVASLQRGDEATLAALLRGDWDFISAHTDDYSLHGWLKAAQLARIPVDDRDEKVGLTTRIPGEAWRVALAGSSVPKHSRLWGTWIIYHGLPADMAASLKAKFRDVLDSDPHAETRAKAGDWHSLMDGLSRSTDAELASFADEYSRARSSFRRARDEVSVRSAARLDSCLPYLGRLTPFLLPDVGWLLLNSSSSEEVEKLLQAVSPWGPEAIRTSILELAGTKHALRAIDHGLALRTDPDEDVAAAAEDALAEIFAGKPDLVEMARIQPRLKSEMEKYLRQQSRAHGGKRRLGGPFGRNKEK
ncbi:GAP1-N2 domain-containing protein [Dermacoccus abyssi]|uniref:GAP1-N2 domain-containing protein n=1 Tax=Dermacoccus abyssi TaxID=322596 RepID=UPI002AD3ABDE|nr:hypothetical protein [Dermacoccus abyssi]